ncbi:MAG: CcmD family protein [Chloroflexi bacterium]|nr:CcmD family protein [Chloroflexota bacterium]
MARWQGVAPGGIAGKRLGTSFRRLISWGGTIALAATVLAGAGFTWASPRAWGVIGPLPQQAPAGTIPPGTKLGFLFAVLLVSWGAFFAYSFFMSRRQQELRKEIEALRRHLEARERQAQQTQSERRPTSGA